MAKLIIEIDLEDIREDDYTYHEYKGLRVKSNDLTEAELAGLAETWAQSDWFYVDFTADIINSM